MPTVTGARRSDVLGALQLLPFWQHRTWVPQALGSCSSWTMLGSWGWGVEMGYQDEVKVGK
jgi:hypothetical protein